MARPQKSRYVCMDPKFQVFCPEGQLGNVEDDIIISVDEYEVFRLLDYEQITQQECAFQMRIARTTVTDIYNRVRAKIADALVNGKSLRIEGGNYDLCERRENCVGFQKCFEAKYKTKKGSSRSC